MTKPRGSSLPDRILQLMEQPHAPAVRAAIATKLRLNAAAVENAVPALIEILLGNDRQASNAAAEVLGMIGPAAATLAVSAVLGGVAKGLSYYYDAAVLLKRIGPGGIPALIEGIGRRDGSGEAAMLALGDIGPAAGAAVPALIKGL